MKKIRILFVLLPILIALPVIAQTRTLQIADDQYLVCSLMPCQIFWKERGAR